MTISSSWKHATLSFTIRFYLSLDYSVNAERSSSDRFRGRLPLRRNINSTIDCTQDGDFTELVPRHYCSFTAHLQSECFGCWERVDPNIEQNYKHARIILKESEVEANLTESRTTKSSHLFTLDKHFVGGQIWSVPIVVKDCGYAGVARNITILRIHTAALYG